MAIVPRRMQRPNDYLTTTFDSDGTPLRAITPLRLVRPDSVLVERGGEGARLRIARGHAPTHRAPANLLERFLACDTTDDDLIAEFVRQHEPLGLCGDHALPFTHQTHGTPKPAVATTIYRCEPAELEPLASYRAFASQMHAIIRVGRDLRDAETPSDSDWRAAMAGPLAIDATPLPHDRALRIALQRRQIARLVRAYVAAADLRPGIVWEGDEPEMEYRGALFAALAAQLMEAVLGRGGLLFCDECGVAYEGKAPRPGDRNYCPAHRAVGRALNVRETRRRRKALELARQGRTIEEVGRVLGVTSNAARDYIQRARELQGMAQRRSRRKR